MNVYETQKFDKCIAATVSVDLYVNIILNSIALARITAIVSVVISVFNAMNSSALVKMYNCNSICGFTGEYAHELWCSSQNV